MQKRRNIKYSISLNSSSNTGILYERTFSHKNYYLKSEMVQPKHGLPPQGEIDQYFFWEKQD